MILPVELPRAHTTRRRLKTTKSSYFGRYIRASQGLKLPMKRWAVLESGRAREGGMKDESGNDRPNSPQAPDVVAMITWVVEK